MFSTAEHMDFTRRGRSPPLDCKEQSNPRKGHQESWVVLRGHGSASLPLRPHFRARTRALLPNPGEKGQPHSDDDNHKDQVAPVLRPPHRRVQAALLPQEVPRGIEDLKVVQDNAGLHDPPDAQVARVPQQDGAHDGDGHEAAREVEEEHVVVRVAHRHGLGDVAVQDEVRGSEVRPYRGDADGGVDPCEEDAVEQRDAGWLEWRHAVRLQERRVVFLESVRRKPVPERRGSVGALNAPRLVSNQYQPRPEGFRACWWLIYLTTLRWTSAFS